MKVGDPFNPYKIFTGVWVPEALLPFQRLSPGSKLAYARLARYGGEHGKVFPSIRTLAKELGVSSRQARAYVSELDRERFLLRGEHPGKSNSYVFIWHEVFESRPRKDTSALPRKQTAGDPGRILPPPRKDTSAIREELREELNESVEEKSRSRQKPGPGLSFTKGLVTDLNRKVKDIPGRRRAAW